MDIHYFIIIYYLAKNKIVIFILGVCIKGSTSSEFEVDYYGRLEEVIELQYHRK